MIPTLDTLLIIALLLLFTKSANLLLLPHQRKAFNDRFELFTLWLDEKRPFTWFLSLPHKKKWHLYLGAGLPVPFFVSIILSWIFTSRTSPDHPIDDGSKAIACLIAWLITVVILNGVIVISRLVKPRHFLLLLLAACITAPHWYRGVMSSYGMSFASLLRYLSVGKVYCYPNLYSNGKPPFWIWEPNAIDNVSGLHVLGYSISGEFAFILIIVSQILVALSVATLIMIIVSIVARAGRAIAWRIAEFDNGPFLGLMAFISFVLGVTRILMSTGE